VISAVGERDATLARELGAIPVRYGPGVAGRVRALGAVDAVFDAAGHGVLADAIALAGGPSRVITLSDPAAADFGVTLSEPTPGRAPGALDETIALLAGGRLRLRAHQTMPIQQAAEAHRQLESGNLHERIILTLPSAGGTAAARPAAHDMPPGPTRKARPVTPHAGAQPGELSPADGSSPRELLLAYVLSFVNIGIYWNNHHHMLAAVSRISGVALWANQHLLFWLSLIPVATARMSENHFPPIPVALHLAKFAAGVTRL
jgi:hypothetical protein